MAAAKVSCRPVNPEGVWGLIRETLGGEEVVIARGNRPLVRLEVLPEAREPRRLGAERGLIVRMDDDFDAPLEDFADYV